MVLATEKSEIFNGLCAAGSARCDWSKMEALVCDRALVGPSRDAGLRSRADWPDVGTRGRGSSAAIGAGSVDGGRWDECPIERYGRSSEARGWRDERHRARMRTWSAPECGPDCFGRGDRDGDRKRPGLAVGDYALRSSIRAPRSLHRADSSSILHTVVLHLNGDASRKGCVHDRLGGLLSGLRCLRVGCYYSCVETIKAMREIRRWENARPYEISGSCQCFVEVN